jgi:hypothetical protein
LKLFPVISEALTNAPPSPPSATKTEKSSPLNLCQNFMARAFVFAAAGLNHFCVLLHVGIILFFPALLPFGSFVVVFVH